MESSLVPGDFKFLPVHGLGPHEEGWVGRKGSNRIQKQTGTGKGGGLGYSFKSTQVSHSRVPKSGGSLDHSNAFRWSVVHYLRVRKARFEAQHNLTI